MSAPTARTEVVYAYANHARWVVDCPTCNGAQLACRTDKRFMCNECANVAIGGRWRVVEWPVDADEIERLLDRRPDVARNWFPGETVRQLKDENRVHGVGV